VGFAGRTNPAPAGGTSITTILLEKFVASYATPAIEAEDVLKMTQHSSKTRRYGSLRDMEAFGLTTAQIFYRMPDHLTIIQWYIWQDYDMFPAFPELHHFLNFWTARLDGPLHSVVVAHARLIKPREIKSVDGMVLLQ
jgi:uncharacterized protein Usg